MTYLELVNNVLRRLRQDEVGQVSASSYSNLIGTLVNTAKREVEDAFRWSALRETVNYSTTATDKIHMEGVGNRIRIEAVRNVTSNFYLKQATQDQWRRLAEQGVTVTGSPDRWRLFGYGTRALGTGTGVDDPILQVWPEPDQVYSIDITYYQAQPDLSAGSDILQIPPYPVILGAYSRAVSERGEDGGAVSDETTRDYQSALNDAIAMDNNMRGGGYETDWVVE